MLQFWDETGLNPLPAGILVTVYQTDEPAIGAWQTVTGFGVEIGSGFTIAGGLCNISVAQAVAYIATFSGSGQAPGATQSGPVPPFVAFVGGNPLLPTSITVPGYRSPTLSTIGYAQSQIAVWPKGWIDSSGSTPGGVPYNIAILLGALFAKADSFGEILHGALRLQSCTGSQIDTWAYDFFGGNLPRYAGEGDASYYARILIALQTPKTTLADIQAMAQAFYDAVNGIQIPGQGMSLDLQGGLDVQGALDVTQGDSGGSGLVPTVFVWDRQSRPDLADKYNVNPSNDDGSFVIQVGIGDATGWYLDYSYLDYDTYLIDPGSYTLSSDPPDPRLGALVNFVKAAGTWPLYLTADLT